MSKTFINIIKVPTTVPTVIRKSEKFFKFSSSKLGDELDGGTSVYPSIYGKPGESEHIRSQSVLNDKERSYLQNTLNCTVVFIGMSDDNASCIASHVYSA